MTKAGGHIQRGSLKGGKNAPIKGGFKGCEKKMAHKKGVKSAKKLCGALYWGKFPHGKKAS